MTIGLLAFSFSILSSMMWFYKGEYFLGFSFIILALMNLNIII